MSHAAPPHEAIRWPSHYEPAHCAVHVRNELVMAAPPAVVWAWLVRAARWPAWYVNAGNVRFLDSPGPDLQAHSRFRWKTFGITITSEVQEFMPQSRLAWNGKALGIDVYHAWLLTPTPDGGCHVLTEESQHGFMSRASKLVFPNRMFRYHQLWLEALAECAASGPPTR